MDNTYVFIVDEKGIRHTSLLVGIHGSHVDDCINLAKLEYPNMQYLVGDDVMQSEFTAGKVYLKGEFIELEPQVHEPTKKEKIDQLKGEAEKERELIKDAFATRQLKGLPTEDLVKKFKKIDIELAKKIRAL